ncbi:unnamed protein product [Trifolium pratense]|uniref:Uncharacterized protein n=1 Tax=Trifolium pratense TaxID=57577 RepID=A0ACB0L6R8_TRIPR|nr:unnamed protein product [Trifolium pratense]
MIPESVLLFLPTIKYLTGYGAKVILSSHLGKRFFVRVDLNVPLDDNLYITDDTRIRVAVPIIK